MRQKITVLVLEDNPDDLDLLKAVLESSDEVDAEIFHAERLDRAIAVAGSEKIDAAILDLTLPDSFGLDTYESFHAACPSVPAIIMTGVKDHELAFEAVRKGAQDYLFKGEPSATAIIRTIRYAIERQRLITELKTAMEHVKQLQGMLPICSICKSIRDDKGYWNRIETYISEHAEVVFSHSICPNCARTHYPELFRDEE